MTKYNVKKAVFFITAVFCLPLLLYWMLYDLMLFAPSVEEFFRNVGIYDALYRGEAVMAPGIISILFLCIMFMVYSFFYRKEISFFGRTLLFLSAVLVPKTTLLIDTSIAVTNHPTLSGENWFIPLLVFIVIMFETALELIFAMKRYPKE